MWATRYLILWIVLFLTIALATLAAGHLSSWWWTAIPLVLSGIGVRDIVQSRHAILRNYPLIGHFRFMFSKLRTGCFASATHCIVDFHGWPGISKQRTLR